MRSKDIFLHVLLSASLIGLGYVVGLLVPVVFYTSAFLVLMIFADDSSREGMLIIDFMFLYVEMCVLLWRMFSGSL